MATNKYTNLSTSSFNPLSLQEIMMIPLARQKQHDLSQEALSNAGIFDVNRLKTDNPIVSSNIDRLKGQVSGLEDELMNKGISRGMTKKLMDIKRERETFLSNEGIGGRAETAYESYKNNVKSIEKNTKLSQTQKDAGLRWALGQYDTQGGVAKDNPYEDYRGANFVNIQEKAIKIASQMKPEEITRMTGWKEIIRDGKKIWTNGTKREEKLPADVIQKAVNQALMNDVEVMDYLRDAKQIGIIDDATSHLFSAGANAGNLLKVNNIDRKEAMKFEPKGSDDGSGVNSDGLYYNTIASPKKNNVIEDISKNTLSKIVNGERHAPISSAHKPQYKFPDGPTNPNYTEELAMYEKARAKSNKPYTVDDLSVADKKKYEDIALGLSKSGIVENVDLKDPVTLSAVSKYENKFQNYTYGVTIVNDVSGGVGKYSTGQVSKDRVAVLNQAKSDKYNELYKNPQTSEEYTWGDLQEKFGVKDIHIVQGYVDLDNNLPETASEQYKDHKSEWVSPRVVTLIDKDGNQIPNFYMTRGDSEMQSPRYQQDIKLNKFFSTTRNLPTIPTDIKIGNKNLEGMFLPEGEINEILGRMQNELFDESGNLKDTASSEQAILFDSLLKAKQRAGNRAGVWRFTQKGDNSGTNVRFNTKSEIQEIQYKLNGVESY